MIAFNHICRIMFLDLQVLGPMMLFNKLYVVDIRCKQNLRGSQPNKVVFNVDGLIPKDMNGYDLVLTNNLISVSCDE